MHIVFLAHRTPYPPNKGEKIRAWHFLRYLARRYQVSLGYFEDDPADRQHRDLLRGRMADCCVVPISQSRLKRRSVGGLGLGQPLSIAAYPRRAMQRFVRDKAAEGADLIVAYSSLAAAMIPTDVTTPILLDMVDVDSAKYAAYAAKARPPMSWVYAREARLLARFEQMAAKRAAVTTLVSADEAAVLNQMCDGAIAEALPNGVDTVIFDPTKFTLRDESETIRLIFTGSMTYRPNIEAVTWFVDQVWPILNREHDWEFIIAGAPVAPEVQKLGERPGIYVTGAVKEMQPVLAESDIAIAPMRTARGVQNKVLEAMAMALPVVATPAAAEGIVNGDPLIIAPGAGEFASALDRLSQVVDVRRRIGEANRRWVREHMSWDSAYKRLDQLIDMALDGAKIP